MKQRFPGFEPLAACLAALLLSGCGQDGPQALLEGDRLLRKGELEPALTQLQEAVQLLPKNARAWNHLGLAQHQNRQASDAVKSYQRALQLDPALTEARYNLGCLYLELNKPKEAAQELASYTVFHRDSIDGWLKLGYAQIRAGQPDGALKSFTHAYQLNPKSPGVLNGFGMIQMQQRKVREASAYFAAALHEKSDFAPALLNLAVLTQQHSTNQTAALKYYRDFLAVKPRPANWMAVDEVTRRLEADLQAVAAAIAQSNALAQARAAEAQKPAPIAVAEVKPQPPAQVVKSEEPRVEPPKLPPAPKPAEQPVMVAKAPSQPKPVEQPKTVPQKPRPASAVVVVKPPTVPVVAPPPTPKRVESQPTTALIREQPKTLSQPIPEPAPREPEPVATGKPAQIENAEPEAKPGFWSRINPLNLLRSKDKPATPLPGDPAKPKATTQPQPVKVATAQPKPAEVTPRPTPRPAPPEPKPEPPPPIIRYRYISPPAPKSGDRKVAQEHFNRALLAQNAQHYQTAMTEYREATITDPAYFEAHSNLAVAALQADELKRALSASEYALTLQPDSTAARNNFAIALQRAHYPLDAALELRKVLSLDADNVQAHFSLGGLYARELGDNTKAREHYREVLELNPRHPQAEAIRYWLAAQR